MDFLILSTLVLIGGALVLTLVTLGPTLWRRLKNRNKEPHHDKS